MNIPFRSAKTGGNYYIIISSRVAETGRESLHALQCSQNKARVYITVAKTRRESLHTLHDSWNMAAVNTHLLGQQNRSGITTHLSGQPKPGPGYASTLSSTLWFVSYISLYGYHFCFFTRLLSWFPWTALFQCFSSPKLSRGVLFIDWKILRPTTGYYFIHLSTWLFWYFLFSGLILPFRLAMFCLLDLFLCVPPSTGTEPRQMEEINPRLLRLLTYVFVISIAKLSR